MIILLLIAHEKKTVKVIKPMESKTIVRIKLMYEYQTTCTIYKIQFAAIVLNTTSFITKQQEKKNICCSENSAIFVLNNM